MVSPRWGNFLSMRITLNKRYTCKGKYEVAEHDKSLLQKKVLDIQEEVDKLRCFQEEVKVHATPSSLTAKNAELQSYLESEKKSREEEITIAVTLTYHIDEAGKNLQKVKKFQEEEQNIYEGHLIVLKKKVDDSLDPQRGV